jgi:hypothetical protein
LSVTSSVKKVAPYKPKPVAVDLKDGTRPQDWLVKKKRRTVKTKEELDSIKVGVKDFITSDEESAFRELIKEFQDIFAFKDNDIGSLSEKIEPPYRIRTVEHEPWNLKPYPMSIPQEKAAIGLLKGKIETGLLEPSHSPYGSRWVH